MIPMAQGVDVDLWNIYIYIYSETRRTIEIVYGIGLERQRDSMLQTNYDYMYDWPSQNR